MKKIDIKTTKSLVWLNLYNILFLSFDLDSFKAAFY